LSRALVWHFQNLTLWIKKIITDNGKKNDLKYDDIKVYNMYKTA